MNILLFYIDYIYMRRATTKPKGRPDSSALTSIVQEDTPPIKPVQRAEATPHASIMDRLRATGAASRGVVRPQTRPTRQDMPTIREAVTETSRPDSAAMRMKEAEEAERRRREAERREAERREAERREAERREAERREAERKRRAQEEAAKRKPPTPVRVPTAEPEELPVSVDEPIPVEVVEEAGRLPSSVDIPVAIKSHSHMPIQRDPVASRGFRPIHTMETSAPSIAPLRIEPRRVPVQQMKMPSPAMEPAPAAAAMAAAAMAAAPPPPAPKPTKTLTDKGILLEMMKVYFYKHKAAKSNISSTEAVKIANNILSCNGLSRYSITNGVIEMLNIPLDELKYYRDNTNKCNKLYPANPHSTAEYFREKYGLGIQPRTRVAENIRNLRAKLGIGPQLNEYGFAGVPSSTIPNILDTVNRCIAQGIKQHIPHAMAGGKYSRRRHRRRHHTRNTRNARNTRKRSRRM
jgi:flagellar biosynthesis GTPase FlhF